MDSDKSNNIVTRVSYAIDIDEFNKSPKVNKILLSPTSYMFMSLAW